MERKEVPGLVTKVPSVIYDPEVSSGDTVLISYHSVAMWQPVLPAAVPIPFHAPASLPVASGILPALSRTCLFSLCPQAVGNPDPCTWQRGPSMHRLGPSLQLLVLLLDKESILKPMFLDTDTLSVFVSTVIMTYSKTFQCGPHSSATQMCSHPPPFMDHVSEWGWGRSAFLISCFLGAGPLGMPPHAHSAPQCQGLRNG